MSKSCHVCSINDGHKELSAHGAEGSLPYSFQSGLLPSSGGPPETSGYDNSDLGGCGSGQNTSEHTKLLIKIKVGRDMEYKATFTRVDM